MIYKNTFSKIITKVLVKSPQKFISSSGSIITVDGNKSPKSFKQLLGFLKCNQGRDCFSKFQGKVWMITKESTWKEVCRNIPDLSYNEYLRLSIK